MATLTANPQTQMLKPVMPSMQVPLVKSGVLHVLVVVVLGIGIPFVSKEPMNVSPPISVEIVDISEITTTPRVAPPAKPKEPDKPPEPAPKKETTPKVNTEKPPELTKPTPPEVETVEKVEDTPPPKPLERKPIEKPEPPKPKEPEVTKKPEPPKPKVEDKPKKEEAKPKEDDFQSLLKNLTPTEDQKSESEEETLDPKVEPDSGQIAKIADQLSVSEEDALRHQLSQCWTLMGGAKYAEELIVEIRVTISRDRRVTDAAILDRGRYNRESNFRAAADAAIRALRKPKCETLQLPPDKYDQWKNTVLVFDPSDML